MSAEQQEHRQFVSERIQQIPPPLKTEFEVWAKLFVA
jgi:hypothetical protein